MNKSVSTHFYSTCDLLQSYVCIIVLETVQKNVHKIIQIKDLKNLKDEFQLFQQMHHHITQIVQLLFVY